MDSDSLLSTVFVTAFAVVTAVLNVITDVAVLPTGTEVTSLMLLLSLLFLSLLMLLPSLLFL